MNVPWHVRFRKWWSEFYVDYPVTVWSVIVFLSSMTILTILFPAVMMWVWVGVLGVAAFCGFIALVVAILEEWN